MDGIELIGTAQHGKVALSKIQSSPPNAVLLDVSMPGMGGFEILKVLRRDFPNVDVIMLSSAVHLNDELLMKALTLGAIDFIHIPKAGDKQKSTEELKTSLQQLLFLTNERKLVPRAKALSNTASNSEKQTPTGKENTMSNPDVSKPSVQKLIFPRPTITTIEKINDGITIS